MNYLNITKYIYLGIGIIMLIMAAMAWNDGTDKPWLEIILACTAFFVFFFRNRFAKKFNQNNNSNKES